MSVESFTPTAIQFSQGAASKVKSLVDEEGKAYYADEDDNTQWGLPPGFAEEGGADEPAAAPVPRRKSFLARMKRRSTIQTALQNAASSGQQCVSSGGDGTGAVVG